MRRTRHNGGFFLCLLLNILLNLEWSVPAWILLILHFAVGISIWWFIGALGAWLIFIVLWMMVIGWASSHGNNPDPIKENKNPYSMTSNDINMQKNEKTNI